MTDPLTFSIVAITFFIGGVIKGVIGAGLVSLVIGVLTATVGLTQAMALLVVPSLITNFWQAVSGGNGKVLTARLWPFFTLATVAIFIGALVLTRVDLAILSALLGVVLIVYAAVSLAGKRITVEPGHERWAGPLMGTLNGLLTGMTGSFVVPGVFYLQAIGLNRFELIQAMGILFTLSIAALGLALTNANLMSGELWLLSTAATVPTLFGTTLGSRVRSRLSEQLFRQVFLVGLLLLGLYIIARALF